MTFLITATYDGCSFQPDEPPPLRPNTRVVLSVESAEGGPQAEDSTENVSFFDIALGTDLEGPPDWSARIDHYPYGIDDGR